ncbi:MAG TPA: hypothetical protein VFK73_01050 [Paludibacter sp.]|nr:hypothetical protein [Paludibacter sp.]
MFGIACSYVAAKSKALPCILEYNMKSMSFSFIITKRALRQTSDVEFIGYGEQGSFAWRTIPRRFLWKEKTGKRLSILTITVATEKK